jgi:hypothetical protein
LEVLFNKPVTEANSPSVSAEKVEVSLFHLTIVLGEVNTVTLPFDVVVSTKLAFEALTLVTVPDRPTFAFRAKTIEALASIRGPIIDEAANNRPLGI